jgi:antitoxin VapB
MQTTEKAKVFMSGRSQAVRIPAEYRFNTSEVYIRRDASSGALILSPAPGTLSEIFTALDELGIPDDFLTLTDRAQTLPQPRPEL